MSQSMEDGKGEFSMSFVVHKDAFYRNLVASIDYHTKLYPSHRILVRAHGLRSSLLHMVIEWSLGV